MKLKSVIIENVRSFRERTTIEFNGNFNILIGPNAGGKSNLLDIITIIIRHYFVKTFVVNEQRDSTRRIFHTIIQPQVFNPIQHLEKYISLRLRPNVFAKFITMQVLSGMMSECTSDTRQTLGERPKGDRSWK